MYKNLIIIVFFVFFANFAKADSLDDCVNENRDNMDINTSIYCPLEESKRLIKKIEFYFEELVKIPRIEKWNNGNGMFTGNMKGFLDTWTSYRNKYCSMEAAYGSLPAGEDPKVIQAQCLLKQVRLFEWDMRVFYENRFNDDASS